MRTNGAEQGFLPTTAYGVLGLLSFDQDLSGYQIRQWALGSQRYFFWSPAQSQIYRELRRLEQLSLVTSRRVEQNDRPDKTEYSLTELGLAELIRWVETSPVEHPVIKHSVALRLYFGRVASPDNMAIILEQHAQHVDGIVAELAELALEIADDDRSRFAKMTAQWALQLHRGDQMGTDAIRRQLEGLDEPANSPAVVTQLNGAFDEIEKCFVSWAAPRTDIRAALVIGSRARSVQNADAWADLDIAIFADDPERYVTDSTWLCEIGPVVLTFTERTGEGSGDERRVLFSKGRDVDFAFFPSDRLDRADLGFPSSVLAQSVGRGYRILVDRVGLGSRLDSLITERHRELAPSAAEFTSVVSNYLYHVLWTAKHLRRGELWWARSGLESHLSDLLLRVIEWHARYVVGESDTWLRGRFLEKWARPDVVSRLKLTGSRFDRDDMERALLAHHALFRDLAGEIGAVLGTPYPNAEDEQIEQLTRHVLDRGTSSAANRSGG